MGAGCGKTRTADLSATRSVSTDPLMDLWEVDAAFTDPRTSAVYPIIDHRVIIFCKDAPDLPVMDSNYFDDESADLSSYWAQVDDAIAASGGFAVLAPEVLALADLHEPDPDVQTLITAEDLEVLSYWPELRAFSALLPYGQTVSDAVDNWPTEYTDLIDTVEPDSLGTYCLDWPDGPPNDELYPGGAGTGQWNLSTGQLLADSDSNYSHGFGINMEEAWAAYTIAEDEDHSPAKIAVIDTVLKPRLQVSFFSLGIPIAI